MNRVSRSLALLSAAALTVGAISSLSGTEVPVPGLVAQPVSATAVSADEFVVDGVHSSVVFRIKHGGVAYFYGSFASMEGTFRIDAADPANTMLNVSIETGSVNSNNTRRDGHLKSPDFFNAEQFPKMTFKSTSAEAGADGIVKVTGDLSYRGKTKSITVPIKITGEAESNRGMRQGFHTEFTINRSDFGDTYGVENGALSDKVTLIVSLQGVRG
ncbi:MAG: YceI family protein [Phycisphaerales bacterium JB050]